MLAIIPAIIIQTNSITSFLRAIIIIVPFTILIFKEYTMCINQWIILIKLLSFSNYKLITNHNFFINILHHSSSNQYLQFPLLLRILNIKMIFTNFYAHLLPKFNVRVGLQSNHCLWALRNMIIIELGVLTFEVSLESTYGFSYLWYYVLVFASSYCF